MRVRAATRFRGNRLMSWLLTQLGNPLSDKKWIFILGCYNSGTTLLDQVLSRHHAVSGLMDEGVVLTDKLPRPEDFGWRRMWCMCEDQLKVAGNLHTIADRVKRHWSNFYDVRKSWLVEKSISNTVRSRFFAEHFQPAFFIHIVRNGYAVTEGIRRKAAIMPGNPLHGQGQYPWELCARQWRRSLEVVDENKAHMTNFLEISYEQLTENPGETVKAICSFLGIGFEPAMIDASFAVHEKDEAITNMNARSLARLSPGDIAAINSVAGDCLKRYGYYIDAPV